MGLCSQKLYMAAPITSTRQIGKLRPRAKRLRARVRYQDQAASAPCLWIQCYIVTEAMVRAKTRDNLK